ncbi:hypothetical protein X727_05425 [Mesorhizobium sp. L103C119B0]|nr:hypothetical protein X729_28590 [Mesorhizobium sp. L103C131B0]ESZ72352.1 hypothetical protein X727_05425 [Mesorhizobium sp. L103C119B0]
MRGSTCEDPNAQDKFSQARSGPGLEVRERRLMAMADIRREQAA